MNAVVDLRSRDWSLNGRPPACWRGLSASKLAAYSYDAMDCVIIMNERGSRSSRR